MAETAFDLDRLAGCTGLLTEHSYSKHRPSIVQRFLGEVFEFVSIPSFLPDLQGEELCLPKSKRKLKQLLSPKRSKHRRENVDKVNDILQEFQTCSDLLKESHEWTFEDTSQFSLDNLVTDGTTISEKDKSDSTTDSGLDVSSDLVTESESISSSMPNQNSSCTNSSTDSLLTYKVFSMPSLLDIFNIESPKAIEKELCRPLPVEEKKEDDKLSLVTLLRANSSRYKKAVGSRRCNIVKQNYSVKLDSLSVELLSKSSMDERSSWKKHLTAK